MKKDIEIIDVNLPFLDMLSEKISLEKENPEIVHDFKNAIENMKSGNSSAFIIQLENSPNKEFSNEIRCGNLVIYVNSRRVTRGGEEIYLTPKEFDILYFLAVNKGNVFTKEQIYQAVWEDKYLLDDSNIMAFIRKLRKKIEVYPDNPEYIITIWGIGYKFNEKL